jgi:hypothetical protein
VLPPVFWCGAQRDMWRCCILTAASRRLILTNNVCHCIPFYLIRVNRWILLRSGSFEVRFKSLRYHRHTHIAPSTCSTSKDVNGHRSSTSVCTQGENPGQVNSLRGCAQHTGQYTPHNDSYHWFELTIGLFWHSQRQPYVTSPTHHVSTAEQLHSIADTAQWHLGN